MSPQGGRSTLLPEANLCSRAMLRIFGLDPDFLPLWSGNTKKIIVFSLKDVAYLTCLLDFFLAFFYNNIFVLGVSKVLSQGVNQKLGKVNKLQVWVVRRFFE